MDSHAENIVTRPAATYGAADREQSMLLIPRENTVRYAMILDNRSIVLSKD